MDNNKHPQLLKNTLRRVQSQAKDKSYSVTIPKIFAGILNIKKGDYVMISHDGSKLIFEKVFGNKKHRCEYNDNPISNIQQKIKDLIIEIAIYDNPHTEIHLTESDIALAACKSKDEFIRKLFPEIFDQLEIEFDINREEIEKKLKGKI